MLHYIKPYRYYAVLTIVFMVSEVLIDLYQPRLMEAIVNEGVLGLHHGGVPDLSLVMQTGLWMALIRNRRCLRCHGRRLRQFLRAEFRQ